LIIFGKAAIAVKNLEQASHGTLLPAQAENSRFIVLDRKQPDVIKYRQG
jgi:hypothetical protein